MGKYRKKPVVIEAIQWLGDNYHLQIEPFGGGLIGWDSQKGLFINTLEGTMTASHGDWIIRGVKGEIYPCKNDIFEATYEAVDSHV